MYLSVTVPRALFSRVLFVLKEAFNHLPREQKIPRRLLDARGATPRTGSGASYPRPPTHATNSMLSLSISTTAFNVGGPMPSGVAVRPMMEPVMMAM